MNDRKLYQKHVSQHLMVLSASLEHDALLTNWGGIISAEYNRVMPRVPLHQCFAAIEEAAEGWWSSYDPFPRASFSFYTPQDAIPFNPSPGINSNTSSSCSTAAEPASTI